jgi:hypothetical protein
MLENPRVKLCGNWAIQVAMGCWQLYNHSNPAEFGLAAFHPISFNQYNWNLKKS